MDLLQCFELLFRHIKLRKTFFAVFDVNKVDLIYDEEESIEPMLSNSLTIFL
jgi:hypothetical protein